MFIYPAELSRHEDDPIAAANAIRKAITTHSLALDPLRGTSLRKALNVIFDDCPYQDMGQSLLNQITGREEVGMQVFDVLAPEDRCHAISAGYAHDAILAANHSYSNPWALIAHSMYWLSVASHEDSYPEIVKQVKSAEAKRRADAKYDQPGGSREKRRAIREIWATGKYSSRDVCAEQECAALDMSFSTARKALRGTPEPT